MCCVRARLYADTACVQHLCSDTLRRDCTCVSLSAPQLPSDCIQSKYSARRLSVNLHICMMTAGVCSRWLTCGYYTWLIFIVWHSYISLWRQKAVVFAQLHKVSIIFPSVISLTVFGVKRYYTASPLVLSPSLPLARLLNSTKLCVFSTVWQLANIPMIYSADPAKFWPGVKHFL